MSLLSHPRRSAAVLTAAATASLAATSIAPSAAQRAVPTTTTTTTPTATTAVTGSAAAIDHFTALAKRRYAEEVHGGVAFGTLHRVGRDATLLRTLRSGSQSAVKAYATQKMNAVWYHWHVSRLRILQGSTVVVDTGVPFVVAPAKMTLRSGGKTLGTLEVSIQDVVGFVRLVHRLYPSVDIVARGQSGQVRTSLPAAAKQSLPAHGTVTISGRRYLVRSFHERALANEPVTVWVLTKG